MATAAPDVASFSQWTPTQFADHMRTSASLGQYYEAIVENKIGGDAAPRLTETDLKEMGVTSVGDRKRFMSAIEELQKNHRKAKREEVLWEGTQVLYFSCWDACMQTCCGCCPIDPQEYKLTSHHLVIKTYLPNRCGPCRCCFGDEYEIDNIVRKKNGEAFVSDHIVRYTRLFSHDAFYETQDLTYITSGDIKGEAPPCTQEICCCAHGRDRIHLITSSEGEKNLYVEKGEGDRINKLILNQIEETQVMERD